jgi:hypothetical protein
VSVTPVTAGVLSERALGRSAPWAGMARLMSMSPTPGVGYLAGGGAATVMP